MNRFFTTMYKERGKPYYPENVAKAEHERLLSNSLLVHPLQKKSTPQQINNKDPVVVQRIKEEKKKLTRNYQLFLDTYRDHFSGKLNKNKNNVKGSPSPVSTPKGEKKFEITVNAKKPIQRHGKYLNPYSRKCLQLDLKFVENETPPPEMLTPPHNNNERPKSKMHNFVLEELERANEEIDSFNTQLKAIQGILNDRKVELKFPPNVDVEEDEKKQETAKKSKSKDFLTKNRKQDFPKMQYRSMADALLGKKKRSSLELLYANDSYDNKNRSFAKLTDSLSEMDMTMDNKVTAAETTVRLQKSSTSTLDHFYKDINTRYPPFPKFNPLYKPGIGSVSTPIPKKNNHNIMKIVEKAKSYSCDKSPKNSLKTSPRLTGRYNSKNKHLPRKRNLKADKAISPGAFKGDCGDKASPQKQKGSLKSPKMEKLKSPYPQNTDCVMSSYIEQKLSPRISLDVSQGGYKYLGQKISPKPNNEPKTQSKSLPTEFQKVLQENVPQGIFGNEELPKGITNSLFLKTILKNNPSGPPNENHLHNAKAVFLRKMQQAQQNAKQQDLIGFPKNNSPFANKKNNSGLYSTFCTALKDTIFEPERNAA